MVIIKDGDGKAVLQLSAQEAFDAAQGIQYGLDTKEAGGWVKSYRNKLVRLYTLLRYAHQQINGYSPEYIHVMNANMEGYERQLLREYPGE